MVSSAIVAAFIIALIVAASEVLWRTGKIKGEVSRKLIHIVAGTFIAFLPFWVDYGWIAVLALGFILVNVLNHALHMFEAVFNIKRQSFGDILFSVAILVCALAEPNKWIFMAAILHVSLADGLAALVGTYLGKFHGHYYKILRHEKTALGTATFTLISFFILAVTVYYSGLYTASTGVALTLLFLPLAATMAENIGIYGADNLILPILILVSLSALAQ
jgi:dolichol kinase